MSLAIPLQPMPYPPALIFYPDMAKAWVYMVRCADGTFYTGWSCDVAKRVEAHNAGKGAKYTRARRPVKLVFRMKMASALDAQRQERFIKKLSRSQKEKLISSLQNELNDNASS